MVGTLMQGFSSTGSGDPAVSMIIALIGLVWVVLYYVQQFLAFGTAYRSAKRNGDNGVSLFGWLIVYSLAACIPGLGVYLWSKGKD